MTSTEINAVLVKLKAQAVINPHITMMIIGDNTYKFANIGDEIEKWETRLSKALLSESGKKRSRTMQFVHE